MDPRRTMILLGALGLALAGPDAARGKAAPAVRGQAAPDGPSLPGAAFPSQVRDIDGKSIDVRKLAEKRRVVVITLKATWCPVCQNQIKRIQDSMSEPEGCGVTFLVLSPGPLPEIRAIRDRLGFPYPFLEDKGLAIAGSLGLKMSEEEIFPAIFILGPDLKVRWMQRGRGAAYYGDEELLETVDCAGLI